MGKRITRRRRSKTLCSKNGTSSTNSAKLSDTCLSLPVLVSDSQIVAADANYALRRRKQCRERYLETNLSVNDIGFENSSSVPDICQSVQSSDSGSKKRLDDCKSEMNSRKAREIMIETKQNLNHLSTENFPKIPDACQSVQSFESYSKRQMKHDNTQNVAAYAIKQTIIPQNIKMEMPENDCIAEHGQNIAKNERYPMYRRKSRERKCKTNISVNDIAFKKSAQMPVASQSIQSPNSNSAKQFNYNDSQNNTIDIMKELIIPIKDIKLEMPEYNSIIEHCQTIVTNENPAIVKRPSRVRKCNTNLNTNDITADKSAYMPITCLSAQISDSDYQMIVPTDNSEMGRRQIRERKAKTNFSQNDLTTENTTEMPNTYPHVPIYDSYGQSIATIDNSAIGESTNREGKSKTNRSLNRILSGSSGRTRDTCTRTAAQWFNTDSTRIFHDANTQTTATDTIKQLIIPVKDIKKEMPEYNSEVEHYQTMGTNDNSSMNRQKCRGRKCKTNHRTNDILSENPSRMPEECPTAQSFDRYSRRFFYHTNTQNTATDIIKELIIPVKRIKMEMPDNNSLTEHCQSMATIDNYAMDGRKSGKRKYKTKLSSNEIFSENTAMMSCPCPSLDSDCLINAANDDPTMDRLKSRELAFKANHCLNDISPENSKGQPDICPTALDIDSRTRFHHSNIQDTAINTMKQLIIPIRDIKLEMPENNYVMQHCQNMVTNENYAEDKRKSGNRDISSENTAIMSGLCSSFQSFDNNCQITATNNTSAIHIPKSIERKCNANQKLNDISSENSSVPPDMCSAAFDSRPRTRFQHTNINDIASNTMKQLIISVRDIKMEMPENNYTVQHCQSMATNENNAVDKRKRGKRDIYSENKAKMPGLCSSLQYSDKDCQIIETSGISAIDILKSREQKPESNRSLNDTFSENVRNTRASVQFYDSDCQIMESNDDNSIMRRRKNIDRKCKRNLTFNDISSDNSKKLPEICPAPQSLDSNSRRHLDLINSKTDKGSRKSRCKTNLDISSKSSINVSEIFLSVQSFDDDSRKQYDFKDMQNVGTNKKEKLFVQNSKMEKINTKMPEYIMAHDQNISENAEERLISPIKVNEFEIFSPEIPEYNSSMEFEIEYSLPANCTHLNFSGSCEKSSFNRNLFSEKSLHNEPKCGNSVSSINSVDSQRRTTKKMINEDATISLDQNYVNQSTCDKISDCPLTSEIANEDFNISTESLDSLRKIFTTYFNFNNDNQHLDTCYETFLRKESEDIDVFTHPIFPKNILIKSDSNECIGTVDTSIVTHTKSSDADDRINFSDNETPDILTKKKENSVEKNLSSENLNCKNILKVIDPKSPLIKSTCSALIAAEDVSGVPHSKTFSAEANLNYSFVNQTSVVNAEKEVPLEKNKNSDYLTDKNICIKKMSKEFLDKMDCSECIEVRDKPHASYTKSNSNADDASDNETLDVKNKNEDISTENNNISEYLIDANICISKVSEFSLVKNICRCSNSEDASNSTHTKAYSTAVDVNNSFVKECTVANYKTGEIYSENKNSSDYMRDRNICIFKESNDSLLKRNCSECFEAEGGTISTYTKSYLDANPVSTFVQETSVLNAENEENKNSSDSLTCKNIYISKMPTNYLNKSHCTDCIEHEDALNVTYTNRYSDADDISNFFDNKTLDSTSKKRKVSNENNDSSECMIHTTKLSKYPLIKKYSSECINTEDTFNKIHNETYLPADDVNNSFLKKTSVSNTENDKASLENNKNPDYYADKNIRLKKMCKDCLNKRYGNKCIQAEGTSNATHTISYSNAYDVSNCFVNEMSHVKSKKGEESIENNKCAGDLIDKSIGTLKKYKTSLIKSNCIQYIEDEGESSATHTKDFSTTADINNAFNNETETSVMNVEEEEFSVQNIKSSDFMTETDIHINNKSIESLEKTNCSECNEAVDASIGTDTKTFSSVNDVSNPSVNETSFANFKKREISLENSRSSEYLINESVPVTQEITIDDENNIDPKDDAETETLVTCNMSMKQNSEIEFKIKVTRKIKKSGDNSSNNNFKKCNEQYIENNIESVDYLINSVPQSVSLMESSPSGYIECNCNVNTSANDTEAILYGNEACSLIMDEASALDNKKEDSTIKNNSESIMHKNIKEKANNVETKSIEASAVSNRSLKRCIELERNSEIARKSIKVESDITSENKTSDDILTNPKTASLHLLQSDPSERIELKSNADPSEIRNETSSSGTRECHLAVDKTSVFANENNETRRNKNSFENKMHKIIRIKEEILNDDRATSLETDYLPNMPNKIGVQFNEKNEISRKRKQTKSCIDNDIINKTTDDRILNPEVRSIQSLQNPSRECNSIASSSGLYNETASSGTDSCSLIEYEASVLDANSESLENKDISEISGLKNIHIKEEITTEDNTKSVQSDKLPNVLQKRGIKVEENTEVTRKRKKTDHDFSNKDKNILQELHLHLEKQKCIVDVLTNITRDINARLLQNSFTEICNNKDYSSRCPTNIFLPGNNENCAAVNASSSESKLRNELSENDTISRNVTDKAVVIKKEAIDENEEEEQSKGTKVLCSRLGKKAVEFRENQQINKKIIKSESVFATFEKVTNVPIINRSEDVDEDSQTEKTCIAETDLHQNSFNE